MSEVIEFALVTFKDSPATPPPSYVAALTSLNSTAGVLGVYFGELAETPGTFNWVIRWASHADIDAFQASPDFPAWVAGLAPLLATASLIITTAEAPLGGSVQRVLESPTVEVFTSFGANDDFLQNHLKPFFDNVGSTEKLKGWHDGVLAEFVPAAQHGVEAPEEKIVMLLFGWDSKEAHLAERGEGKLIDNNIHLVRGASKSATMHHVDFKKL